MSHLFTLIHDPGPTLLNTPVGLMGQPTQVIFVGILSKPWPYRGIKGVLRAFQEY